LVFVAPDIAGTTSVLEWHNPAIRKQLFKHVTMFVQLLQDARNSRIERLLEDPPFLIG
jgi:hypothetical protein